MLYGIGEIHVIAIHARVNERPIEHSTRWTHKRMTRAIFRVAGLLADEHHVRGDRALAKHCLRRVFVQRTRLAFL
jgi:hypothetical protein